ncbi:MAG: hypothetical protein ACLT33_11910 [Lachnospira pectinoschiza]
MANLSSGILAGSLKADGGSLKIDGTDAFMDVKMFRNMLVLYAGESLWAVGKG